PDVFFISIYAFTHSSDTCQIGFWGKGLIILHLRFLLVLEMRGERRKKQSVFGCLERQSSRSPIKIARILMKIMLWSVFVDHISLPIGRLIGLY
ncbi:hypothetical protein WMO24_00140, partial [Ruthenibacterium sp. CLA-JM-H11]